MEYARVGRKRLHEFGMHTDGSGERAVVQQGTVLTPASAGWGVRLFARNSTMRVDLLSRTVGMPCSGGQKGALIM